MPLNVQDIVRLLTDRGAAQYGEEAVSQLDHALQCAHLAEEAGESDALVIACLLHDLGHMLAAEATGTPEHDTQRDDLHQYIALPFLRGLLPPACLEPIRLHVDAKRFLCQSEAGYADTLSPASVHSLQLQGGPFTDAQARDFMALPHAAEAVRLRRYDDLAKDPARRVPPLLHHLPRLQRLVQAAETVS